MNLLRRAVTVRVVNVGQDKKHSLRLHLPLCLKPCPLKNLRGHGTIVCGVNVGHNKELQLHPCLTVRLRKLCLKNSAINVGVVVAQKEELLLQLSLPWHS
jgi:hypothetical protein